ncbi:uncharacterized protein VICG_00580 [Vittaforma corneae ATCC 50505]|uniref:Uncharacterized protein n=1 Tax=Vittaforma corneae (strain ATCC 50505) TaxID=993615 RepID=L2GNR1_VITCO|nr:uncharacterized protein VICG_00580 [Vittaforma corneae ATCC 50505]ELA42481.1 hypothetical protein VICG_00580 [Vittaforma corneae ATCC 50505]
MIEIEQSSKRGFAYGKESFELLKSVKRLKFQNEKYERTGSADIWSFDVEEYERIESSIDLLKISNLKCRHDVNFTFTTVHRLPQEGWEELIDCWSCHNSEFKGMLDLKIKPRKNGILVSNFYLIAGEKVLPECCKARTKMFYNELTCEFSVEQLIFKFFEEYFEMKNSIILKVDGKSYEIKLFYRCILIEKNDSFVFNEHDAFKVGYKETAKNNDEDSYIGDYFKIKIIDQLGRNSVKLSVLGYALSFITQ